MLFDSWAHQFCLACDKQVQVDNNAYCSESCRLADFERTASGPCSQASSPGFQPSSWGSSPSTKATPTKFYLSPAYDFSNAKPYGQASPSHEYHGKYSTPRDSYSSAPARHLSTSSSHSSLCSINSTSTSGDASHLSEKARKELQAYAVSFEQVRTQRRRSY
ncbi:hypothetical protein S40285_01996 [Stachybotrys chlorohalonatus IBT 40285]|uniref:Life-span regulatory factor domain-containing protein n=1 Tax=Stachybotrys chlorohalonatus (strain IBT 40285) TaxID=1283841 RepID=A0A084QII3_STAC4|nr:hypothetical protein S40285_01996 [Stachybotrys chlorohalonata IBT 40285]